MKQQALFEFNLIDANHPAFDISFQLFRYKHILEVELADNDHMNHGGLDIVRELALAKLLKQCEFGIEKSAMSHYEFWSQLSEDNPDLAKLNKIGTRIITYKESCEHCWNKLSKANVLTPKILKFYGNYVKEIINDEATGDDLLNKARDLLNSNSQKNKAVMTILETEDLYYNSTPTVLVAGDIEKLGTIVGLNSACGEIFGYTKVELLNNSINMLMPTIYANIHGLALENFLTNDTKYVNNSRIIFGKDKNGYMFQAYINIKPTQNNLHQLQFIGTFKIEKFYKPQLYLLTENDGSINCISTSCIQNLRIDNKQLLRNSSITYYFPEIFNNLEKC